MNLTAVVAAKPVSRSHSLLRKAGLALSASLLVAAAAHVALPLFFTPVPMTLAPMAVLAVGLLLGPAVGFSALALYLLEGMAGLPVLCPTSATGAMAMFGPTGGYLIAYPFVAALAGWGYARLRGRSFVSNFAAAAIAAGVADLLLLASGSVWLMGLLHLSPLHALALGAAPFLPGEAVKVALVAAGMAGVSRLRKQDSTLR